MSTYSRRRLSLASRRALAESLESRTLFSVSGDILTGPFTVPGVTWTYATADNDGHTGSLTDTVVGPTTFNGQNVYELDSGVNGAVRTFVGFDGAGNYVTFGSISHLGSGVTETVTYTQPGDGYPAQLNAGVPVTTMAAYTYVDISATNPELNSTTNYTDTQTVTLVSDATESVTVPAGTYDAYHVHLTSSETDVTDVGTDISTTDADGYFVAGIGLVKLINHPTENGNNSTPGFTYELSAFTGANKLAFIQNPLDSAVKDTIKPLVTVAVEDSAGNIQTAVSGSVTLSIGSATGTGTLTGTLTEPVINGIATFPDLSVDAAGTYRLSAHDAASDTPTLSSEFDVTAGKLKYLQAPHDGTTNSALNPGVIVEVVDSDGNLLTSSDGSTVTLQTIGVTGQAQLTGNTATIESGKAVFPSLVFKEAGSYTLQATDSNNDTFVNAGPFKISADILKIVTQPKSTDVATPLSLKAELVDKDGKVDTKATGSVNLTLNTVSGGANATLGGGTSLAFTKGVAYFTTKTGPTVSAPGTYTLTATKDDNSTSVTSSQFTIAGAHLIFKKAPKSADAGAVLNPAYQVAIVNAKGKVLTSSNDLIELTFALPNGQGQQTFSATAVKGLATFTAAAGSSDIALGTPGTYAVTAVDETDANANPDDPTIASATGTLVVNPAHLVFKKIPATADANEAIPGLEVAVENSKNQIIKTQSDTIQISFTNASDPNAGGVFTAKAVNGVAVFADSSKVVLTTPGGFTATASDADDLADNGDATVTKATASLQVLPNKLILLAQPRLVVAGQETVPSYEIEIVDSKKHQILGNTDNIDLSFTNVGTGQISSYTTEAENGIAVFGNGFGPNVVLDSADNYNILAVDTTSTDTAGNQLVTPYQGIVTVRPG